MTMAGFKPRTNALATMVLLLAALAVRQQPAGAATVSAAFDMAMRNWIATQGVRQASVAVMYRGRLVHAAGFGGRRPDERVGVWSLGKAITAVCVATLVRDGLLAFDDPVERVLAADFARAGIVPGKLGKATIRHLVTHRSGLPTWVGGNRFAPGTADLLRKRATGDATAEALLPAMLAVEPSREPGESFQYSNVGYLLLGRIIEGITGQPYEAACAERVLAPAGIAKAGLHPLWGRLLHATAGWTLSGPEYLAFARVLRVDVAAVLDTTAHRFLRMPEGSWMSEDRRSAYTLGIVVWRVDGRLPHLSHTGGWNWRQDDALGGPIDENPGTLFVLTNDDIGWFVSFDRLERQREAEARAELDRAMWRARRAVTTWPDLDAFGAYGVAPLRTVGSPSRAKPR